MERRRRVSLFKERKETSPKEYFFQIMYLANSYGSQLLEKASVTFRLLFLAAMLQKNKEILWSMSNPPMHIYFKVDLYLSLFFHFSF